MKKLVSLIALTASLSLHASNPAANLPTVKTQFFVLGMARPATPLTQDTLRALIEQEKAQQRAQRQEQRQKNKQKLSTQASSQ